MKTLSPNRKALALALLPLLLIACGGGGGDDSATDPRSNTNTQPTPNTNTQTGNNNADAAAQIAFKAAKQGVLPVTPVTDGKRLASYYIDINGKRVVEVDGKNERYDYSSMPSGFTTLAGNAYVLNNSSNYEITARSYQGFHSGVFASYINQTGKLAHNDFYGASTPLSQIPLTGKATYRGIAFDRTDRGNLTYNVDFATRQGSGDIEGISRYGTITLHKNRILRNEATIVGSASAAKGPSLKYEISFFGPAAEEIAGRVSNGIEVDSVGLHGTRGEISP